MDKIKGLIDAPFTPFHENGEVNYEPIEAYAKLLVKNGLKGVFINGSSGEGYMLTEEERKYARNPLTHVDFLLFNQMDKQPVLAIEVDGTGFHEVGSKQAERDIKKNSILEKCAVPLLRLRTDGSGEKEKIKDMLKTAPQK